MKENDAKHHYREFASIILSFPENASIKNFRSEVLFIFDMRFVSVFTLGSL